MEDPLKRSRDHQNIADNENRYSIKKYLQLGRIHGLKYLGRNQKSETLFWIIVLSISFILAVFCVNALISPRLNVMTRTDLPAKPLHFLPFPAVTICPETKTQKSFVNFTAAYHAYLSDDSNHTYTDEEIAQIEAVSHVCDPHLMSDLKLKPVPTPGQNFLEILRKISVPSNFLLFCKFRGKVEECTKFFKETITDDGICFTFNMLEAKNMFNTDEENKDNIPTWSVRTGYISEEFDAYPYRAFSGADVGFNIVLNLKTSDIDFICRGPVQGYKMKIHSPDEHPRMATGYQRIPFNSEVLVNVKPEATLNFDGTSCHSEKPLKYFKQYSQANCVTECISSHVLSKCDCVKFSMVHKNGTEICNQHQTKCLQEALDEFNLEHRFEKGFPCDCKPSCDQLSYDTKVSQAVFDFQRVFNAYDVEIDDEFPSSIMSRVIVYFGDDSYVQSLYVSTETTYEAIAKIGGVLAFFLGASIISVIEIFFYIFRRLTK